MKTIKKFLFMCICFLLCFILCSCEEGGSNRGFKYNDIEYELWAPPATYLETVHISCYCRIGSGVGNESGFFFEVQLDDFDSLKYHTDGQFVYGNDEFLLFKKNFTYFYIQKALITQQNTLLCRLDWDHVTYLRQTETDSGYSYYKAVRSIPFPAFLCEKWRGYSELYIAPAYFEDTTIIDSKYKEFLVDYYWNYNYPECYIYLDKIVIFNLNGNGITCVIHLDDDIITITIEE